jgi:hypothetical protein
MEFKDTERRRRVVGVALAGSSTARPIGRAI